MRYRIPKIIRAAVDQSEPMYSPPPSGSPNGPLHQKHSPVLMDSMQPVVHSMSRQGWQMQSPQHLNNNTSPPQGISGGNNGLGVHPVSPQQMNMLGNSMAPMGSPPMGNSASNSPTYHQNMVSSPNNLPPNNLSHCAGEPLPQTCLRNGCSNLAIDSADWDREYCSSECVVSHCKDVFANWVTQRQMSANAYSTVN